MTKLLIGSILDPASQNATIYNELVLFFYGMFLIMFFHECRPENLKTSWAKNSTNAMNQFHGIFFDTYVPFFMENIKKFFVKLIYLISRVFFLAWTFYNFLAHCAPCNTVFSNTKKVQKIVKSLFTKKNLLKVAI